MPSTYTGSGIELIGDGEQSGSWGNTTNNNLEIINRLVSEAGTIALAGTTHTLSIADGTLSDGQYAVLVFGGAPSGTNTVTLSPNDAKRVFIVKNSSGQSVILTQGSGGNVTVPNGKTAVVYSDGAGSGAAVVNVSDDFIVATLTDIGALTPTDGNFIVGNGSTWVVETGNTVLNSIGVTATTAELNVLDGITASTAELNFVDGVTANIQTQLDVKAAVTTSISAGTGLTGGGTLEANRTISHADTSSQASVDNTGTAVIQDVTLDDFGHVTALGSKTLALTDFGVTATSAELNIMDGVTATTAELNFVDGVTSNIQTQLNALDSNKQPLDAELTAIAALATTDGNFIVGNGATWVVESGNTVLQSIGVTATTTELNVLDGVTATTAELNLLSGQTSLVPAGVIVMWSGAVGSIPTGWSLCDGTNGTPDLRNRFVVGAGSTYAVDATGGSDSVTLSEAQIPGHTHSVSGTTASDGAHTHNVSGNTSNTGAHTHNVSGNTSNTGDHAHNGSTSNTGSHSHNSDNQSAQNDGSSSENVSSRKISSGQAQNNSAVSTTSNTGAHSHNFTTANAGAHSHTLSGTADSAGNHSHTLSGTADSAGAHTHTFSTTSGSTGSGTAHENRPPYYALAYIMKT
jgi:microcystin-dependent protein